MPNTKEMGLLMWRQDSGALVEGELYCWIRCFLCIWSERYSEHWNECQAWYDWSQVSPPVLILKGLRINEHVGSTIEVFSRSHDDLEVIHCQRSSEDDLLARAGRCNNSDSSRSPPDEPTGLNSSSSSTLRTLYGGVFRVRIFISMLKDFSFTGEINRITSWDVHCRPVHSKWTRHGWML